MDYTALYRKFRPQTFGEMVGQEHITKTLKNQILSDRVGHAYLFSGGRGTGKTSSAKILARAINCLNIKQGEPCNECEICKASLLGSLTDVVEMDAASNNSVEDIRAIREEVNFLPTLAKYRIYIIDEVHMLSTGAFNALLKTLEEPPLHVKFILATTEPQKLPATILSRCQRFDFKRISNQDIVKRLEIICKQSKIDIAQQALNIIAVLSEGAMRDALSILERCLQDGENKISEEKIRELVGIPSLNYINEITKNILEYNVEETLDVLDKVIKDGKDINYLIWEMLKYIKDLLIYKVGKKLEIYSQEEIKQIAELSEKVAKERLISMIYSLSDIENSIKYSPQKLVMLQTGLIKLCTIQESHDIADLLQRVKQLEENLKDNKSDVTESKQTKKKNDTNNLDKIKIEHKEEKQKKQEFWKDVLADLKQNGRLILYTNLINSEARLINDKTIGIEFKDGLTSFARTILEKPENISEITKLVSQHTGNEMKIKYLNKTTNDVPKQNDLNMNDLGIPINIID